MNQSITYQRPFLRSSLLYLKNMWTPWPLGIIVLLLMALFGLTAFDKVHHFGRFYSELGKSPFLMAYAGAVGVGTPLVEAVVVWLLADDRRQLLGLYSCVFLMSLFSAYIYVLMHYSYYTPCLCSAAIESLTWGQHLIFNGVFLVLAIAGVIIKEYQLTKTPEL